MLKRTDISTILIVGAIALKISLASAEAADIRFEWSAEMFAARCGFKVEVYAKARPVWFTDRNYSDKWLAIDSEKLKACGDCYRVAEFTKAGPVRLVRLSTSSESGDWLQEIHYCFDQGKELRAVHSIFNCAWGWSYVQVFLFEKGSLKPLASKWQHLTSGEEIAEPEAAGAMSDHWSNVPIYEVFSDLPFAEFVHN